MKRRTEFDNKKMLLQNWKENAVWLAGRGRICPKGAKKSPSNATDWNPPTQKETGRGDLIGANNPGGSSSYGHAPTTAAEGGGGCRHA